ncbi:RCC1 domain-containing protein [Fluviispira multicolorata]|uniref:Alpha-tubulin suppressor n=1 Tax=Fluviispira multicolorata TaxID=2654512 RepID=A0A833JF11_9BACT|nr:RCC1 domain-containing protein [Fluviispira multicolorata]KAB8030734.1 hypothetical protein GCL57_07110 [Fluviispira multicolorata]
MKIKMLYFSLFFMTSSLIILSTHAESFSRGKRSVIWNESGTFQSISINNEKLCAIKSNSNETACFNLYYDKTRLPPQQFSISGKYKLISMGERHTCAISNIDSSLYCWGFNKSGQIGIENNNTYIKEPSKVNFQKEIISISTSQANTYVVDKDGDIWGWGTNMHNQIPNSNFITYLASNIPRKIPNSKKFFAISSGDYFMCSLSFEGMNGTEKYGNIYCVGDNKYGQHGNGKDAHDVIYLTKISYKNYISLAAGKTHICAITTEKKLECWGNNNFGQLSYDPKNTSYLTTPHPVISLNDSNFQNLKFKSLALTDNSTCAITTENIPYCFGDNTYGQLGGEPESGAEPITSLSGFTYYSHYKPKKLMPSTEVKVKSIAGNARSTCIVTQNNELQCFGFIQKNTYSSLSMGSNYICGISSYNTRAFCSNLEDGLSGHFANPWNAPLVTPWASSQSFSQVSVGIYHSCGVTNESPHNTYCWSNPETSEMSKRTHPQIVEQLNEPMSKIVVGSAHSCAISKQTGSLFCSGNNGAGQLGNGNFMSTVQTLHYNKVILPNVSFKDIALSDYATCAVSTENDVYCFGINKYGELGNGGFYSQVKNTPQKIKNIKLKSISGGNNFFCGMKANASENENKVICWGDNSEGQIGLTHKRKSSKTVELPNSKNFISVNTYVSTTCLISKNNEAFCLGNNLNGIISSDNPYEAIYAPIHVQSNKKFNAISIGNKKACGILTSDKTVFCWGNQ